MPKNRNSGGFTLIELLVVVIVIGILASIALANYVDAQNKARLSSIKANMHTVQVAAESYATETGGQCGTIAQIKPYFPGGSSSVGGAAGKYPTNPCSNIADQTPDDAGLADVASIQGARAADAGSTSGTAGNTAYSKTTDGLSYGILGFDHAGKSVASNGSKQMCLSNN
jgi:prepilin-type N-terminal cleavage/methylation domain-containing protein